MKFRAILISLLLAFTAVSVDAQAGEIKVIQKDKKFSPKKIISKIGNTIVFLNDDDFTHNLYSRRGAAKFDSGALKANEKYKLKLDKAGNFTVRCAIHPKMKLRVKVK